MVGGGCLFTSSAHLCPGAFRGCRGGHGSPRLTSSGAVSAASCLSCRPALPIAGPQNSFPPASAERGIFQNPSMVGPHQDYLWDRGGCLFVTLGCVAVSVSVSVDQLFLFVRACGRKWSCSPCKSSSNFRGENLIGPTSGSGVPQAVGRAEKELGGACSRIRPDGSKPLTVFSEGCAI